VVAFRNLSSGRTWTLKDNNAECAGGPLSVSFLGLALGGKRAVWSTGVSADFYYTSLESAVAGGGAKTVVSETTWSGCGSSDLVQAQAADGGIVVYSYVNVEEESASTCAFIRIGGGVYSVVPDATIPGLRPAYALAVGDGLIADLPAHFNTTSQVLNPRPNQPVYLYNTRTRTTRTVQARGDERRLAVSSRVLAVFAYSPLLAKSGPGHLIERFNAHTGAPLGSTPVPADTNPLSLAASGSQIVYSTGREIWLLDGLSGKRTLITTAGGRPIGLSVEGKRVYWVENRGHRGSILTLTLP
jgi:hypothetical protein